MQVQTVGVGVLLGELQVNRLAAGCLAFLAGLFGEVELLGQIGKDRLEAGDNWLAGIPLAELQGLLAVLGEVQGCDQRGGMLGQQASF